MKYIYVQSEKYISSVQLLSLEVNKGCFNIEWMSIESFNSFHGKLSTK